MVVFYSYNIPKLANLMIRVLSLNKNYDYIACSKIVILFMPKVKALFISNREQHNIILNKKTEQ